MALLSAHVVHNQVMTANSLKKLNTGANRKSDHAAYSRSFPNWNCEKEIHAVKITKKLSYLEARKVVESRNPSMGVCYSSLLRQQSKSVRHVSIHIHGLAPPYPNNSPTTLSSST